MLNASDPTSGGLTHLDEKGAARMVDVTDKAVTDRVARAAARVWMQPETLRLIAEGNLPKGDVLAAARLAGIMAAKRTADLIPLCHPLPLSSVEVSFHLVEEASVLPSFHAPPSIFHSPLSAVEIETRVRVSGKTGVEMEALTAAAVAALTLYDMCKAVDKAMVITDLRLLEKRGGQSDRGKGKMENGK